MEGTPAMDILIYTKEYLESICHKFHKPLIDILLGHSQLTHLDFVGMCNIFVVFFFFSFSKISLDSNL